MLLRQGIGCAILLALLWTPATAEEAKISFDIPAGGAIETLKTFSTQSNARLLYSVEAVSHVRTKLVKGIYMPREALAIMLAGTDLVATQNPRDGAFAVSRLGPSNSQPPQKKNDMKEQTNTHLSLLTAAILSLASSNLPAQSAQGGASGTPDNAEGPPVQEEPIVMNPFDVNTSSNAGYGAASTASTSRLQQNYVDIPQTVNVVTSEFIADFNLQDNRTLLEYVSNMQFGANDGAQMQIRGAVVTTVYEDGVALPTQIYPNYNAMPMEFFDRVEVVKGPSSAAFGLGQPGGLINFVSKTPQGINTTTLSFAVGDNNNYLAKFDTQGVAPTDPSLKYRLVGFWDDGGYMQQGWHHNGAGAQLSLRYDFDKNTHLDLIVAYSSTDWPYRDDFVSIWKNKTLYETWQLVSQGLPHSYLPGTVFPNGAVFGVSGTPPPLGASGPGSVGILGTGKLIGVNADPTPAGFEGDTEAELRTELIATKDLADGHIHLRNVLFNDFLQSNQYDQGPSGLDSSYSIPTLPPNFYAMDVYRFYSGQASDSHTDEFDALLNCHFFGGDWTTLIGGDVYDYKNENQSYSLAPTNADGSTYYANLYGNNPAIYLPANGVGAIGITNASVRTIGDGFYAQEDVNFLHDMVDLLAGWRIDYFEERTRNFAGGDALGLTAPDNPGWVNTKGAPRFAVTLKPMKWFSVYGLYTVHKDPTQSVNKYFLFGGGTEITPVSAAEFPLNELEFYQPGGYTIEEGTKASFLNGTIYASVAVFHEITTGNILLVPPPGSPVVNPDGTTTSFGENEIVGLNCHGIEAEVFGQLTRRLTFTANYGIVRGYYPQFGPGMPDWFDPSMTISAHGKYDFSDGHGKGWYLTFGGEFFGPMWVYEGASEGDTTASAYSYWKTPQYLFNGGIGYKWKYKKTKQSIYLNCDNIANSLISIPSITPWVIEPLRETFLTYSVTY